LFEFVKAAGGWHKQETSQKVKTVIITITIVWLLSTYYLLL